MHPGATGAGVRPAVVKVGKDQCSCRRKSPLVIKKTLNTQSQIGDWMLFGLQKFECRDLHERG